MSKTIQLSSSLNHLTDETVKFELDQEEDQTLSDYYEKCMDQAHIDGVPKYEVSKTVLHILDEKLYQLMLKQDESLKPRRLHNSIKNNAY